MYGFHTKFFLIKTEKKTKERRDYLLYSYYTLHSLFIQLILYAFIKFFFQQLCFIHSLKKYFISYVDFFSINVEYVLFFSCTWYIFYEILHLFFGGNAAFFLVKNT